MLVAVTDQPSPRPPDRPEDQPHATPAEYALEEAASLLGISREAVRLGIRRSTLAGHRTNGRWVVRLVEVPTDPTNDRPHDHLADYLNPRLRPTDRPHGDVDRLEQLVSQLEGERDRLVRQLEAREREVERFQEQASNYQVLLLRAGIALLAPASEHVTDQVQRPTNQPTRNVRLPWWERVLRALQGK